MKKLLPLRNPADLPEAIRTARFAMLNAGFRISDRSDTGFTAEKGSPLSTLVFGWLAGRRLWTIQYVDGLLLPDGTTAVQLRRDLFDDVANEKYLGPAKLQKAFDLTVEIVRTALKDAQLLN